MEQINSYFLAPENKPFTHKEYIYVINYKYNHPNELVHLALYSPTEYNFYTHLLASINVPLICIKTPIHAEAMRIFPETIEDDKLLEYPFFNMPEYISRGIESNMKVLDLGCGNKAISNQLPLGKITTVDAFEKFLPDVLFDLSKTPLPFLDNSYDVVLLLDVIEHLEKTDGFKLLNEIKRVAKKRVFIFTPLFWIENDAETLNPSSEYYNNKYNFHKSLWSASDFPEFKQVFNRLTEKYFFGYWEKK